MKKITLKGLTLFLFILIVAAQESCVKSGNNNGSNNTNQSSDTSLLFALNVTANGFNDASMYKNAIQINNSSSKITTINGVNFLEFGTEFNQVGGFSNTPSPSVYSALPNNKFQTGATIYIEVMNSINNSNTLYKDTTSYNLAASIGIPAGSGNINFFYSNSTYWVRRLDWRTYTSPCNTSGSSYIEFNSFATSGHTPNIPLSITKTLKLVGTVSKISNTVNIYINGALYDTFPISDISFNGCPTISNGFIFCTQRGTLLKNLKVWNRALSQTEIAGL
jgi:hypothetical protein